MERFLEGDHKSTRTPNTSPKIPTIPLRHSLNAPAYSAPVQPVNSAAVSEETVKKSSQLSCNRTKHPEVLFEQHRETLDSFSTMDKMVIASTPIQAGYTGTKRVALALRMIRRDKPVLPAPSSVPLWK